MIETWTTETGEVLLISEMTTEHIINCELHLRKRVLKFKEEILKDQEYIDAFAWEFMKRMSMN